VGEGAERLEELSLFPERSERIQALIEIAESYTDYPLELVPRSAESKVLGCESEVFFAAESRPDGTQTYRFAVDNPQGISAMALAVMLQGVSGSPLSEVNQLSEDLVLEIFGRQLSMGKSLGLTNMVRMLKRSAASLACQG
jgi:cysteine desulfuration protein SufE